MSTRSSSAHAAGDACGLRVLRLCAVFDTPAAALSGRGVRFDPVGGMQNHTAQLTRALDALGVRQEVLTSRPPGTPRRDRCGVGVVVRRFGLPVPWARQCYCVPAAIAALGRARAIDLIHVHQGEDLAVLPIGLAAARKAGVPLVVTLHTSLRHTFAGIGWRARLLSGPGAVVESAVCARADAIIALTDRLATRLIDDGVRPAGIHVIPPGVNPTEFTQAPDPVSQIPHPRIVFVGRLAPQKGPDILVQAVAKMRRRDAHVILVGDGPLRAAVEQAIATHRLRDRVWLLGFRTHSEIPAILQHADVFCLPSRYEELSSAVLEAMWAGLPIVATAVGGLPDAVGPAGRLVAPDDSGALAGALDELLDAPERAARLAAAARERAAVYDWSALAARIHAMYHDVLRRRPTQRADSHTGSGS